MITTPPLRNVSHHIINPCAVHSWAIHARTPFYAPSQAPGQPRAALKCDHNKIDEDVPQKSRPGDRERQTQAYDCPGPNALKEVTGANFRAGGVKASKV
jgi:hypothetical protein